MSRAELDDDDTTIDNLSRGTSITDLNEGFDDDLRNPTTLRELVATASKHVDIGAAVLHRPLFTPDVEDYGGGNDELIETTPAVPSEETKYAKILRSEFNCIVVEHHLKWSPLCVSEPGPLPAGAISERLGRYDFHYADSIVDWALEHNMKVKGHVLVWHVTSPVKLLESMEPSDVKEHLKRHIFTVMGHFRGRIKVWDVVNEALAPDGTLAENVFFQKLGPSYIEDAFRWAHEADPSAILLYNDNKVEGNGTSKGDAFYELLSDLKAKEVPVHGCGLQAHFNGAGVGVNRVPTPRMVKAQIRRLGNLGLSVNISEMDVRVSKLPPEVRVMAQRQIYHDIVAAALSEPAFDGVWLWGFSDRHTWVSSFYYDDEPLIFDESYERKEAYFGLRDALSSIAPGGRVGGEAVLLDTDVDVNGNPWGHLWMQPEAGDINVDKVAGDAQPDWKQPSTSKTTEALKSDGGVAAISDAADRTLPHLSEMV